jgi:hypothetical protein
MKIAVCFSGQFRTGYENAENIKNFLKDVLDDCDFFAHFWDFDEYKTYNNSNIKKKPTRINEPKLKKFFGIFEPKKYLIESKSKMYEIVEKLGIQPLWYSFFKCNNLKKKYEEENNIIYDYVIKLRTDTIFYDSDLMNELVHFKSFNIIDAVIEGVDRNMPMSTDVLFISDSKNMDVAANYVWELMKYFETEGYVNFIYYMKDNGIEVVNTQFIKKYVILREVYLKYLTDLSVGQYYFNKISFLENYFFTETKNKNDRCFINDLIETNFYSKNNISYYEDFGIEFLKDMNSIIDNYINPKQKKLL